VKRNTVARHGLRYDVPPKAVERLEIYITMLDRWRRVTNLISDAGFTDVWRRHIADGLFLQSIFEQSLRWLDIGSGAGFPSVVVASVLADVQNAEVHCVESDKRKCTFLREVADKLRLPIRVHNVRAELIAVADTGAIDVVTARAFSSASNILALTDEFLSQGALAALPRGKTWTREIETIDRERYRVSTRPVPDSDDGVVVVIEKRVLTSHDS
jgi:16S rRNA (guanine527-N7)-methyltransferase